MELTASNIAICTIATTRCAARGVMRGVTKATAFSFQSVITSAKADGAEAINATATSACCALIFVERPSLRIAAPYRERARDSCASACGYPVPDLYCGRGTDRTDPLWRCTRLDSRRL